MTGLDRQARVPSRGAYVSTPARGLLPGKGIGCFRFASAPALGSRGAGGRQSRARMPASAWGRERSSAPAVLPPAPAVGARGAGISEQGTDLISIGMAEFVENGEGFSPCVPCGRRVTSGAVGAAEADESPSPVIASAGVSAQLRSVGVARHGVGVAPEAAVGVSEIIPGMSLVTAISGRCQPGDSLLANGHSLVVVPEESVKPAHFAECPGLACRVAGGPAEIEAVPGVTERFDMAAFYLCYPAEPAVGPGLAHAIAELAKQALCAAEVSARVAGMAQPAKGDAEAAMHVRLACPVG